MTASPPPAIIYKKDIIYQAMSDSKALDQKTTLARFHVFSGSDQSLNVLAFV
jgi:hypothetical protein